MSQPISFKKITATISRANVAQKLSEVQIFAQQIEIHVPTSGVTGPMFIGDKDLDSTWIPRSIGSTAAFTSSGGGDAVKGPYFDLSKIYVLSATAGDSMIVQYTAAAQEA